MWMVKQCPTHLRKMLVDNFLGFRLLDVNPEVVECLRGEPDDPGLGHHTQGQLLVHQGGARLRHVALVGDQTRPGKELWETLSFLLKCIFLVIYKVNLYISRFVEYFFEVSLHIVFSCLLSSLQNLRFSELSFKADF